LLNAAIIETQGFGKAVAETDIREPRPFGLDLQGHVIERRSGLVVLVHDPGR
jgi:hypothetical protein